MNLPIQAAPVARGHARVQQTLTLTQQGCNWLRCGSAVVTCAAACLSGVGTTGCIACVGSAYDSCKDCF